MKLNSSPVGMEDKNEIIIMIEIFKRTVDYTAENISEKIHTFWKFFIFFTNSISFSAF